ncbi:MAG: DUF423 domain-containing protein [Haliscomenobacter sp.]|nr:DUF423 domain-containing protein [Haliscomenobacter sp.]MBK8655516.1 DUF423 domain-containing protein [Haliscomenobacter sp.]MBP9078272.1 DUF423 domain-containing protein [Haliscomenobacter sp.]
MRKLFLRLGSALGMFAVMIGAFGAHTLRPLLTPESFSNFETGVKYHLVHSLAILGVAALLHFGRKKSLGVAGWLFAGGVVCFSGSLYLLSTREVHGLSVEWLGPITPLGGILLIVAWGLLFASTFYHYERHYKENKD